VPTLAGQEWPPPPAPGAVKGASIIVLAIAVAVVAMSDRTAGRLSLEQRVGDPDRSKDQRVPGITQAEADELEELGADCLLGGHAAVIGSVADRHYLANDVRAFQDLHWQNA
jgi:hypothetical protein